MVFTSCSNDDNDSSDSTSSILVKKRIFTESDGTSYFSDYLYEGNKLKSVTDSDGSVMKYTYTGNLITKIEEFDKKGNLNSITDYNYINGKLDNEVYKHAWEEYYYKTKYTYNANGTVEYNQFEGNVSTGTEEVSGATGKYTIKDGNQMKLEVSYGDGYSYVYEYDTKNNPFKNILGFDLLFDDESYVNNLVMKTSTSGSGTDIRTSTTTYTYKYDVNNYPTEQVAIFSNETSTETTQFVY